jgi:hypothetical protein
LDWSSFWTKLFSVRQRSDDWSPLSRVLLWIAGFRAMLHKSIDLDHGWGEFFGSEPQKARHGPVWSLSVGVLSIPNGVTVRVRRVVATAWLATEPTLAVRAAPPIRAVVAIRVADVVVAAVAVAAVALLAALPAVAAVAMVVGMAVLVVVAQLASPSRARSIAIIVSGGCGRNFPPCIHRQCRAVRSAFLDAADLVFRRNGQWAAHVDDVQRAFGLVVRAHQGANGSHSV